MYEKIFSQIGLSEQEAVVYEIMLELGEARAKEIYQKSPFKRGLVYKLLDNLIEKHLITRIDKPNAVSTFRVEHPDKLNDLVEAQERKVRHYKKSVHSLMPELISNYNLAFNKPGIKFFEGEDGIKKVLWDTLTSQEEILAYSDIEAIDKYIPNLNTQYVKKRELLRVKKRAIVIDTPYSRKFLKNYYTTITENKFINSESFPFQTLAQIYDGKLAYITLSEESMIGIIIQDKNIYQMHKSLFEYIWKHAKTFDQLEDFSKAK